MPAAFTATAFSGSSSSSKKSKKIRLLRNHTLVDPKHANRWQAEVEKSKKEKHVPWVDVGDEQDDTFLHRGKQLARSNKLLREVSRQSSKHGKEPRNGAEKHGGAGDHRNGETSSAGASGSSVGSANHIRRVHQSGNDIPEHDAEQPDTGSAFDDDIPEDMAHAGSLNNPNSPAEPSPQQGPGPDPQATLNGGHKAKKHSNKREREEEEQEEQEVAEAISVESPRKNKRKKRKHSMVNGANGAGMNGSISEEESITSSQTLSQSQDTTVSQLPLESAKDKETVINGHIPTPEAPHQRSQKSERRIPEVGNVEIKQENEAANADVSSPRKAHKKQRQSISEKPPKASLSVGEAGPSTTAPVNPASKKASEALQEQRKQLPIAKGREALIEEIRKNDVTVLLGETGSGKTTQIPQYILESGLAGSGMIAVTQPRRVAATSLASRVALESGGRPVGSLVGYSVRFDEKSNPETRIKYMTDGMIVRELLSDSTLSAYSVVVVDEAHERTLRTDLLIANLKRIQKERNQPDDAGKGKGKEMKSNPLKIVVMSATLDAEKFSRFFGSAKVLYVQGRQHPVKIHYSREGQTDYVDSAMRTFFQIHLDQPPGDVLIFLPGQEDIEGLEKSIQLFAKQLPKDEKDILVCSMYAAQAPGQNAKVFMEAPPNTRKCILATNIAETSITIPGVKYVIDTGMCKEKRYLARDTGGGFDTLMTKPVTKSSATQRSGRAGREGPGMCFRLYTEDAFRKMPIAPEPEIMRVSLTSSILQLKCLGQNLEELDLMDMPDIESVMSALKTLWLLDAINANRELTPLGRQMARFPLEPVYARAILAANDNGCTLEVIDIISVLSASSKLFIDITEQRETAAEARKIFKHTSGDHLTVLNAVRSYTDIANGTSKGARRDWCRKHFLNERALLEASEIRNQLRQTCTRLKIDWKVSCGDKEDPVLRSLAFGLAQNSAFLQADGSYKQTMGQSTVKIHPSSVLCERKVPAIVYDELIFTNQIYARGVSSVPKAVFASIGALNRRAA